MLTCALLSMLATADVRPAFLSDATPRAVHLVSRESMIPSYRGWSLHQLRVEYDRLDEIRPGVGLPIFLVLTGATGLIVSLIAYAGALGNFRGADTTANISFGLGLTTSAAMVSIGGILLWRGAEDRRVYGAQMDALQRLAAGQERDERLLDLWEQRHRGTPPPLIGPPPVGPPVPPSAPPIVPGPKVVPGEISLVVPLVFARF